MDSTHTLRHSLHRSRPFLEAKAALVKAITDSTGQARSVNKSTTGDIRDEYLKLIQTLGKLKGRELYYPFISSGLGAGPFVELMDGSRKIDLINGIGINFFGHSHPALIDEMIDGLTSDVMQGNLQPGIESEEIIRTVLSHVGTKSRLRHGWLFGSGTMANETALKIIRQKKYPATRIFAFADCFAGRSTAMQEITDNPKYREGQPTYNEVTHLPFYDPALGVEESAKRVIAQMCAEMTKHPGKYAGLMIELVQGEGGIRHAPREWYVRIFTEARKENLAVWFDEVQTFGRLENLFAYQYFDLAEFADVVTVGKLLHACMALYTEDLNPKAGLVAGTFTGSAAALRTGRRIVELLTSGGYYGPHGKIAKLSNHFRKGLVQLQAGSCLGLIGEIRTLGGMIGFSVLDQSMNDTKKFLMKLFDNGVVAFFAGHDPYIVRCLPAFGVMTESEIDDALGIIETTLLSLKP